MTVLFKSLKDPVVTSDLRVREDFLRTQIRIWKDELVFFSRGKLFCVEKVQTRRQSGKLVYTSLARGGELSGVW